MPRLKLNHPERAIEREIIQLLRMEGWYVKHTVGNAFTAGWPDLFACHHMYGQRWIEVKLPGMKGSHFTVAQMTDFPLFCANGSGVWVMTAATKEEYRRVLFNKPNWSDYIW